MASIKQLKSEVVLLTNAVLADCEIYLARSGENKTEVFDLVDSALRFEKEVRAKINAHKKITSSSERREYFKQLVAEIEQTIDELFARLSKIIQK
jgi:hypothetical protein